MYPAPPDSQANIEVTEPLSSPNYTVTIVLGQALSSEGTFVLQSTVTQTSSLVSPDTQPGASLVSIGVNGLVTGLLSSGQGTQTEVWLRGDDTWQAIPDGHLYRYIRQRHCDYPLGTSDPSIVTGAGAAISQIASGGSTNVNHPGIWSLISGTSNNGVAAIYGGLAGASNDFSLGMFSKMAFRAVVKTSSVLPSGAVGASTFGQFVAGFTDGTMGNAPAQANNNIIWRFNPASGVNPSNWLLFISNGSTSLDTASSVPVAINTWYDLQIYVDQNGVLARCASYSSGSIPTLLQSSFITANVPANSASMNFQVMNVNGTSGTTAHQMFLDLYEAVGEIQGRIFRGDQLVTAF